MQIPVEAKLRPTEGDYNRAKNAIGLFYPACVLWFFTMSSCNKYEYILQKCTVLFSTVNRKKCQRCRHHNRSLSAYQSCWSDSTIWTNCDCKCVYACSNWDKIADVLFQWGNDGAVSYEANGLFTFGYPARNGTSLHQRPPLLLPSSPPPQKKSISFLPCKKKADNLLSCTTEGCKVR